MGFNQSQRQAIGHRAGPMMVVAGPGSGKTTVITYRIQALIKDCGADPRNILVITFARAAAAEMSRRFQRLMGGQDGGVTFGTFHSFFFTIIRRAIGYSLADVLDENERRDAVRSAIHTVDRGLDDNDFIQLVLNEISLVKNELITLAYHNPIDLPGEAFRRIMENYEDFKAKNHKIDFDDMLTACYRYLKENPMEQARLQKRYPYIMIDEFQDINRVQYETIKLLAGSGGNLFVVGDDDQSIYRFRGSRPEFMLQFSKDFPTAESVVLSQNYRSTEAIIGYCNVVIAHNQDRYPKLIQGMGVKGPKPLLITPDDPRMEAVKIASAIQKISRKVPLSQIAVVYRTNMQAIPLIDVFMDMRIPFQIRDEAPGIYEHWITGDICAYFRLAHNRADNEAFERIANKPKRYIRRSDLALARRAGGSVLENLYGRRNMEQWQMKRLEELMFYLNALKERSAAEAIRYLRQAVDYDGYLKDYAQYRQMSHKGLFEIISELQEGAKAYETIGAYVAHIEEAITRIKESRSVKNQENGEAVTFSTMHGVKGLEYDTVFVVGLIEGVMPHEKSKTPAELAEECRMLYVAATRAKARLILSAPATKNEVSTKQSRFIADIQPDYFIRP